MAGLASRIPQSQIEPGLHHNFKYPASPTPPNKGELCASGRSSWFLLWFSPQVFVLIKFLNLKSCLGILEGLNSHKQQGQAHGSWALVFSLAFIYSCSCDQHQNNCMKVFLFAKGAVVSNKTELVVRKISAVSRDQKVRCQRTCAETLRLLTLARHPTSLPLLLISHRRQG